MFRLNPSQAWLQRGNSSAAPVTTGYRNQLTSPASRWTALKSIFSRGLRIRPQSGVGRRASDSVGRSSPGAFSWKSVLGPADTPIRMEFTGEEWMSPEENAQLIELHEGADSLVTDLGLADAQIAALQAEAARNGQCADLSLAAQQSFAKMDTDLLRWNLRAEEIERNHDPQTIVAFSPRTGSIFAGPIHYIRSLWQRGPSAKAQPQRTQPAKVSEQRRSNIRQDLQRLVAPTLRLRQYDLHIKAAQAKKMQGLRAQMNSLAKPRNPELRKVALARLSNIHDKVDQMALDLHLQRKKTGNKINQRLDRRCRPRAAAPSPAPVVKPPLATPPLAKPRNPKDETV